MYWAPGKINNEKKIIRKKDNKFRKVTKENFTFAIGNKVTNQYFIRLLL